MYNSFNSKGTRWSTEDTQTAFKWGSVVLSAIGCGVALYGTVQTGGALALTGAVAWACSKFIFSAAAALTPNDIDNGISYAIGAGSCVLSVGENTWACSSTIMSTINYGLGAPPNKPPEIFELSADPSSVNINETTQITCYAYDPDGDLVKYWWGTTGGKFEGNNNTVGPSIYWEAPSTEGNYIITCVVFDGKGGEAEEKVTIPVSGDNNEENEIESICSKVVSALNNKNWNEARSYCINGSEAYNQVSELEDAINNVENWYGPGNLNINTNINNIVVNGNYATVYGYFDSTFTAGSYFDENSGSITGNLEKISSSWKIYEGLIPNL